MPNTERQLTLTIGGPDVEDGKIPLATLAGKLNALQKALFNVALARSGGPVALLRISQRQSYRGSRDPAAIIGADHALGNRS